MNNAPKYCEIEVSILSKFLFENNDKVSKGLPYPSFLQSQTIKVPLKASVPRDNSCMIYWDIENQVLLTEKAALLLHFLDIEYKVS